MMKETIKQKIKSIKISVKEIHQKLSTKLKWRFSGSYTVEAAYIMPLLLLSLFMIMSYAFFFHGSIIADVWAAHLTEEGRMAVSYGKIPFDSAIYLEGFDDETGYFNAELLMSEELESHSAFLITGRSEKAELSFSDDEVGAEIKFSMDGLKPYADDAGEFAESYTESRSIYNPQKYARITKGVYRFAKKSLFK